jgi:hypothetical protein
LARLYKILWEITPPSPLLLAFGKEEKRRKIENRDEENEKQISSQKSDH